MSGSLILCYSNDGLAFRAVDPGYVPQAGEVLFDDYATGAQLAAAFPNYVPPAAPQPSVLKSTVMGRLTAAQMASAYTMLTQNPVNFGKWFAPDRPYVNCNDPDAVAVVKALGLDPAIILAAG